MHAHAAGIPCPRYADRLFGTEVDSGCVRRSRCGHAHHLEYYTGTERTASGQPAWLCHCHFYSHSKIIKETARISLAHCDLWETFDVHVVSADGAIFLRLAAIDLLGLYFNNIDDSLTCSESSDSSPTVCWFGFDSA